MLHDTHEQHVNIYFSLPIVLPAAVHIMTLLLQPVHIRPHEALPAETPCCITIAEMCSS